MSSEDKIAREMATLTYEQMQEISSVQKQHGMALANIQAVQDRHGRKFDKLEGKVDKQQKMLEAIMRHMEIEIPE